MRWLGMLSVSLLVACQGPADDSALLRDAQAAAEARRIRAAILAPDPLPPQDFADLQALRQRYPQSALLEDSLVQALLRRADWTALEGLLSGMPPEALSDERFGLLLRARWELGQYPAVVDLVSTRRDGEANAQWRLWWARSLFNLGRLQQAAELLDRHRPTQPGIDDVEALVLRAQIHQHAGQLQQAIGELQLALRLFPQHKSALNTLARVHHARGEVVLARQYEARARQAQDQLTDQTRRQLALVAQVQALKAHWAAGDHAAVVASAEAALPLADVGMKRVLLEYLIQSNQQLGRQQAAQAARRQLERLQP